MQSGTTGINTVRMYNPIKQGIDQDPNATFIRKWVPELDHLSTAEIHKVGQLYVFRQLKDDLAQEPIYG